MPYTSTNFVYAESIIGDLCKGKMSLRAAEFMGNEVFSIARWCALNTLLTPLSKFKG